MARGDVFVDVGKSGIRLEYDDGVQPRSAHTPSGISPAALGDQGHAIASAVLDILGEMSPIHVGHIVIGSTAELTEQERLMAASMLHGAFPTATVSITDDGTLAHARLMDSPGILLSAGTGVIAIARGHDDRLHRRDGWGPLVGDRGGAVSVGLAALRASFACVDDHVDSALRRNVESVFGALGVETARDITARTDWPSAVAELAPLVCSLAADGDPESVRIVDDAVDDLMDTIRRTVEFTALTDVMILGRFGMSDQINSRLTRRLKSAGLTRKTPHRSKRVSARHILDGPYRAWMNVYDPAA